ncbi:MAG: D-aminoacylase [Chloroflexi bacterium]|nr:D-aminoacylase [Chloroflexota bacterium]
MSISYDLIIRNGTIYDGSGQPSYVGDVAINGKSIAALGKLNGATARKTVDASGLAVAPGFINIMSWAPISLIADGRSQSDIRQGVTLEVFGEASSEGPMTEAMRKDKLARQGDIRYDIPWTTLGDYLEYLEQRGVSTNFASFVGASTLRIYAVGYDDRPPSPSELELMRKLARQAMEEGAMGVSSALIYAPGSYAQTPELIELARVSAAYGGIYISHLRSEGNRLLEAIDELIEIARAANIRAEIYHLKAIGKQNWGKMSAALQKVDDARLQGLQITADMYTYTAGATGLDASMPGWVQEGGHHAWLERLKDPAVRARLRVEMSTPSDDWENMYLLSGGGDNMLFSSFKNEALKPLTGKTLGQVTAMRGTSEIDTMLDLVVEDDTRVGTVYFTMTESNLVQQLKRPWVCLGSDASSQAPEGVFLKSGVHPRAYGCFSRFLAKYVRDEQVVPLEEAIRKMTSLPASTLRIQDRGRLEPGAFADVVVFDPVKIQDHATFDQPQQYATGMLHVFVNGLQVLENGEHTGVTPGQIVRGPGWKKSKG